MEHSIIESNAGNFDILELPLAKRVFLILGISALFLIGTVFIRIVFLSWWKGDFYKGRSEMNAEQPITIPSARGAIYDRFGNLLAQNQSSYRVVLNAGIAKLKKVDIDAALESLAKILAVEKSELDSLLEKVNLEKSALITLERNVPLDEVKAIKELAIPGIEIQDDYRRDYLKGPAFAHVLGYTGLLKFKDVNGKAGLEKYYNDLLSGEDGLRLMYRNAEGKILDEKLLNAPKDGQHLYTTIESGLQEYFYERLSSALRALGRNVGVGIAINPQNGEILSLVNLPSYDNNVFTDAKSSKQRVDLLRASFQPLFDRAVSGVYTPGSTIKPLVAVAALKEKVVDTKYKIYSPGYIEIPNPYNPDQPSRFLDWRPQGWVDLHSALARSSNVYFYEVGGGFGNLKGLGIEKLKEYWQLFGFGEKTGIDLDSESIGFLPDPQEKEKRTGDIWRIGDTYNVAIGQGDFQVTPIQLINYIAAIANGGKFYKPHFIKESPEVNKDLSNLSEYIKEAQAGMIDGVNMPYGTSHLLADLPMQVAAKTGSSQVANNTRTNAFFVGYLPAEALAKVGASIDKQIAILVLIENAREGSLNAVPIANGALNWYYWNRLAVSN